MHFHFRNVNDAFRTLVEQIDDGTVPTSTNKSRAGEVRMVREPVIVSYSNPWERVLLSPGRDCNPFFHLFEALWMLAGRNDVEPLLYYNPRMAEFSDHGVTLRGAYGFRWRWTWEDQLHEIVRQLKEDRDSRRVVLTMWDPSQDLFMNPSKDKCCNTHAYFAIRAGELDMTVCNRSNDLVWGMLGANAVHFAFLQEYLAARIGVPMGNYHQMTNNLHVYTERWEPEKWLAGFLDWGVSYPKADTDVRLVKDADVFDYEVGNFIDSIDGEWSEPFLRDVAQPMMAAFRAHKQRRYHGDQCALELMTRVQHEDWQKAGMEWINRRMDAWKEKSSVTSSAE